MHQKIKELQQKNEQLHHDNEQLHHDNEQLHHDNERLHHDKDELQSQLDGVVVANAQLASCNSLLRSKCDQMLEQLSVKEAKWSHYEEQLQLQVSVTCRWVGLYYRYLPEGMYYIDCYSYDNNGVSVIKNGSQRLRIR